jgi:hypothetical protein
MLFDDLGDLDRIFLTLAALDNCAQISKSPYSRSLPTLIELGARSLGISVLPSPILEYCDDVTLHSRITVQ